VLFALLSEGSNTFSFYIIGNSGIKPFGIAEGRRMPISFHSVLLHSLMSSILYKPACLSFAIVSSTPQQ
jgi:hypothetical protein